MKIFVSGATGAQGGNIAHHLVAANHKVITLSSKTTQVNTIEIVAGGLQDVEALKKALYQVDAAVFMLPLVFDVALAQTYTNNFVEAAKAQNVPLVVYNTSFDLPSEETGKITLDMKLKAKAVFAGSGLNVITLVPDIYIDNMVAPWSLPVIMNDGVLPYPIANHTKVPFISLSDLGRFTTAAVTKPELAGKTLPVGGNLFTGEEIAAAMTEKLGKTVNFVGVKPNDFEQQLIPAFGEVPAREISNLYRFVADKQAYLVAKDFKATQELLGVTPQTLAEWVNSVAWTAEAIS